MTIPGNNQSSDAEDSAPVKVRVPVVIDPKGSAKKLGSLGFDPIQKLVEFHDAISLDIAKLMYDDEGNPKKYSQAALASMMATQKSVMTDLLRYGYARQTESIEVNTPPPPTLVIQLSETPEAFDIEKNETAAFSLPPVTPKPASNLTLHRIVRASDDD